MGTKKGVHSTGKKVEECRSTALGALSREEIGNRLRLLRIYRDLSQLKLATLAGYGCKEVVGRTESGERELAYHEALAYADILCFCLNAFGRTEANGEWNMMACLLPYPPPATSPAEEE